MSTDKTMVDAAMARGQVNSEVDYETTLRKMATDLVATASLVGFVVTIEQRPVPPLAMGNHETVVSVRPDRRAK